jgi:hypothetical protein
MTFKLLILILFFLSQLTSIFLNKKPSPTLDLEENQLAMVAIRMLLKIMAAISPLFNFGLRFYKKIQGGQHGMI